MFAKGISMGLPQIRPYALPDAATLPPQRAPWQFDPARAALLIHDMQSYFCAAYPPDQAPLDGVVQRISALLAAARAAGVPVFYTAQNGNQPRAERGLQADFWGPGMSSRPEHESILAELAPTSGDVVLVKHRYSAFQRSNFEALLRARGKTQLLIAGVYAHIGCLATAVEAFQRDIQPFAIADAQADFDRERHDMAMTWVAGCCGGVMLAETAIAQLQEAAAYN